MDPENQALIKGIVEERGATDIVVMLGAALWFVYRVAKGWLALRAGKPVGGGTARIWMSWSGSMPCSATK